MPPTPRQFTPLARSAKCPELKAMPDQALFLLGEDSPDDILLLKRAFLKANILNPLKVVNSGEEAILYLSAEGPYSPL